MDPAVVGSAQFGLLFRTTLPGNYQGHPEQVYSQPLVYTLGDGIQYLFVATQQNNVYKINAKTGAIALARNLARPFLQSDLGNCNDINPHIGITATGVIDSDTDTWYLTSKTYADPSLTGATGLLNGRYYIHAINTNDLTERPNFPVSLEGMVALNNLVRVFNGGIHHQRPALLHYGQYIYAAFASHCIQYNYTGWIVGWDKTSGALVEQMATEGAGVPNTVPGAGVWMSGGGITSDGAGSMWFASGNGYASQLDGVSLSGRQPPTSLEEAAVHATINDDGSINIVDFFMPFEKVQLDGADKDLGTSPLELLPSQFACGDVQRIGVVTGKSGKTYWLNMDNLGGYQTGPNNGDAALQVYQNENSVYAGAGVYPFEGGYIYINVIGHPSHVFKFSCTNDVPAFTKVADTTDINAGALGVGHGTVTSLNDQPGTGLMWVSDVEGLNLRIYNAVPGPTGNLTLINSFNTPGVTKFTRPVFGDGIAYQGTIAGYLYAYGSPVNLPMNCTSFNFGTTNLNASSPSTTIQCQANTALQVTALALSGNPNFLLSGVPTIPRSVAAGSNFSFQATFAPTTVGSLSSSVIVNTTQSQSGYSINTPIQLKGIGQSQAPLLSITPNTVSFSGVITGQQAGGVNQSIIFNNIGNGNLGITAVQFSTVSETGPWISANASSTIGPFTFIALPSTIPGKSAETVTINFNPATSGNYAAFVLVNSNGGSALFDVVGQGGDVPVAKLEFQTPDGTGWAAFNNASYFSFGNVAENTSRYLKMRLTNIGGPNASALSLTVSKPPFGDAGLIGAVNNVDLAEGTNLLAGQNATATLFCSVPKSQINTPSYNDAANWTMNLGDPNFGLQHIEFFCEATAPQYNDAGQNSTGLGQYGYVGCFEDADPNRELQVRISVSVNNTNEMCIAACSAAGYIFAGTEYVQECWCGNYRPKTLLPDGNCNYGCAGNQGENCGGNGINGGLSMISLFADSTRFSGNYTASVGPFVNPGVLGFTSLGCWTDPGNPRTLSIGMAPMNQIVRGCLQVCQGYQYAGVEYGGECYCGNTLAAGSASAPATDCNMVCNGNNTELCGAGFRLNLYGADNTTLPVSTSTSLQSSASVSTSTTSSAASIPSSSGVVQRAGNYSYVDCHTDSVGARTLTGYASGSMMTVEYCANVCQAITTMYMGVEYSQECYCGNTLTNGATTATDGRCNMLCAANASEICGGPNGLTLYQFSPLSSLSSTPISSNASSSSTSSFGGTLNTFPFANGTSSTIYNVTNPSISSTFASTTLRTIVTSLSSLSNASSVSSPSYLNSTAASNATSVSLPVNSSSTISPTISTQGLLLTTSTTVNMSSALTSAVSSGASSRTNSTTSTYLSTSTSVFTSPLLSSSSTTSLLNTTTLFSSSAQAVSMSTVTKSSSTTALSIPPISSNTSVSSTAFSTLSSSASLTSSANPTTTTSWTPLGCYTDSSTRTLPNSTFSSPNMTTALCQSFCLSSGFPIAGTEYASQCFCGSNTPSSTSTSCTMPCSGAANQTCGGPYALGVYSYTGTIAPLGTKSAIGNYTYAGCFTDDGGSRTLSAYSNTGNSSMTEEGCVGLCSARGYPYAGAEYGQECWCGNSIGMSGTKVADSDCGLLCTGNSREYCGAGNRLSVWVNSG